MSQIRRGALGAVLAVVMVASCTSSDTDDTATMDRTASSPSSTSSSTSSTTTSSTTTSTTAPPPPSTTTTAAPLPVPAVPTLGRGARGPDVLALERRLEQLHFDVGAVDDRYDANTSSAVMAFQKVHNLARNGTATKEVLDRLGSATDPPPLLPDGGRHRVEIDLKRQVLFLYEGGNLFRILPVATGNNKRYCVDGGCATAVTPGGSYRVSRRIRGWRTSRLGRLYNPLYFNGGIAIHGSTSVPAYPASHGCVRISMSAAQWFPSHVPNGTPVYVVGGRRAPVPFNEPEPADDRPDAPSAPAPAPAPARPAPPPPPAPAPTPAPAPAPTTTTSAPPAPTTSTPALPPTTA